MCSFQYIYYHLNHSLINPYFTTSTISLQLIYNDALPKYSFDAIQNEPITSVVIATSWVLFFFLCSLIFLFMVVTVSQTVYWLLHLG